MKSTAGGMRLNAARTSERFVEDVWLPFVETRHSSSTLTVYQFYWNHILKPRCASKLLRDFRTPNAQAMLDEISRLNPEMRKATLHKLKSILSAIFKLAIQQDYRPGPNPIRETTLPKAPESQETHAYDLGTIKQILDLVPEIARPIVALAAYAGLSRSEIQGLLWEGLNGSELTILSSVVRGKRGALKTRARRDTVPLIEPLRQMLEMHRLKTWQSSQWSGISDVNWFAGLPTQRVRGLHQVGTGQMCALRGHEVPPQAQRAQIRARTLPCLNGTAGTPSGAV